MKYTSALMALAIVITVTGPAVGGCGGYGCGQVLDYGPGSTALASPYPLSGGSCCGARVLPPQNPTPAQVREISPASCCKPAPSPRVQQVSAPKGPTRNPFQLVAYDLRRAEAAPGLKPVSAGQVPVQALPPCCQAPAPGQSNLVKPVIPGSSPRLVASVLPKSARRVQTAALSNRERVETNEPSTTASLLKWPPRWAQPALEPGRISTSADRPPAPSRLPPCCANGGQSW
jgi:hypothetical protein